MRQMNNEVNLDRQMQMLLYDTHDSDEKVGVVLKDETLWVTQKAMATLFDVNTQAITKHLKNIYEEGELVKEATCSKMEQVQIEGTRNVSRQVEFYNLDAIISVGYRVNSAKATKFRIWATSVLKEYIKKGFVLDSERLKNLGGAGYFQELIVKIRDIRASEKVFYRQVLEIYATSIDYDPRADVSLNFFKKVQNKIHYAVSGQTAAEIIFDRVDAQKDFMGLTVFNGLQPTLAEAKIAKNYLNERELKAMGQLVSGYLDFAERQAEREIPMTMDDWAKHLDKILTANGEELLQGSGNISHSEAMDKVKMEYQKYQAKTLSAVEQDYLDGIKQLQRSVKKE
ncbi:MAG: virulence RhuM family protein [Phascolarctobacterium sp.]|nr:virulence RhuM family protein [Phascolarctobacterium sp.]